MNNMIRTSSSEFIIFFECSYFLSVLKVLGYLTTLFSLQKIRNLKGTKELKGTEDIRGIEEPKEHREFKITIELKKHPFKLFCSSYILSFIVPLSSPIS